MNALEVIAQARAAGLRLSIGGDRLMVAGPRSAALPLLDELRAHKWAIMAALADEAAHEEAEVAWRVAVLRPHVPREGPIMLPPVRAGVPPLVSQDPITGYYTYHTHCGSCGEPREEGQTFHCRACQRARSLVVNEAREGVLLSPRGEAPGQQPSEPAA